jgi:ATP adenylyltransferase
MNHLWSPWRMTYIENPQPEDGCIFCNRFEMQDDFENLILHRRDKSFVILNRYPYTNGHMMIVPVAHVPSLTDLEESTLNEMMMLIKEALQVLSEVYGAESFNVGSNIGEPAGAGVAEHVHIHLLPRWAGDTSFMTSTASTRVLPEALEDTYNRLRTAWQNRSA